MRPSGGARPSQRPYNVAYYARNREREIERVSLRAKATLEWLRDLRRVPCMDCGQTFPPYAMDFDHRDPSVKLFALAGGNGGVLLKSRAELESEIAKCDVVCANCHRIRTHRAFLAGALRTDSFKSKPDSADREVQRAREKTRDVLRLHKGLLRAFKRSPCFDCGGKFPWFVMEFDHRDGTVKLANVPQMAGRVGLVRLLAEIEKCDIVCAVCHRIRTYNRREAAS